MWHPQSDEAHGNDAKAPRWVVPWVYPGLVIAAIVVVGLLLLLRPDIVRSQSGERTVAGAIRWTGDGWAVLDDATHDAVGIESLTWDGETLTVRYTFTADSIVTFIATTDETMGALGYRVGASVSRDEARIRIVGDEPLTEYANLWVYGVFR